MEFRLKTVDGKLVSGRVARLERYVNERVQQWRGWESESDATEWARYTLLNGLLNIARDAYAERVE